ncbi:hypothetical protein HHI36_009617 [Cryptolaemus montrouzieri]|uniref:KIF-binding protein n=1 Tax=Cryptolaemus montrouzieri TaxID=559131 RepID=A0ABD2MGF4_9CUCU
MAFDILNDTVLGDLKNIFDKLKVHLNNEKTVHEISQNNNIENTTNNEIAQTHLNQLLETIEHYLERSKKSSADYIKLLSMKASLIYEQAKIKLFHESGNDALSMLQSTLELIEEYSDHDYMIFLYLRIVNHLSYLSSKNGKLNDARQLLENVLYKDYSPNVAVYSTEDLFDSDQELDVESCRARFNKLMLNNVQMLGWVYGKLGFHDLHAFMEHLYLQKQLDMEDIRALHWTSKCCRLVTLYLTTYNWIYARYYLAAIEALLNKIPGEGTRNIELAQAKADLSKAWIHYGLHLFSASKKKLLEQIYSNGNESTTIEEPKAPLEILEQHKFRGLSVTVPNIPINYVTDTQEARTLFIHTQNWLKQMRSFYNLKDYPLQYVNAVLDLSELYRFLAFYETDLESQYNVQKRRSETLEALSSLLREVRPNCYTAVSVEIWRELAEVQIELMGINLKRLYTYESKSHLLHKTNVQFSIEKHYTLDSNYRSH